MNFDKSTKNFSFIAIARFLGSGSQAIFYLIFAFLLDPEMFGELSYLIAIAGTASIISRFGLNQTVTVFQAKNEHDISNQINVLAVLTTSIAAIILIPINIYAAILSLSISFFPMEQYNLLGKHQYKRFMRNSIVRSAILITIPIGLYYLWDLPGILIGMSISYYIFSFDYLKLLRRKVFGFKGIKNNFHVILHNFGVDLSTNLPRRIDKLFIVPILGFSNVGLYHFNLQILLGLELIPIAIHSFLLSEESGGKQHKKIEYAIICFAIGISILAIIVSPYIIPEIFPKYSSGIKSLQIMILTIIPLSIVAIYNAKLQAMESTRVGFAAICRLGVLIGLILTIGNWYGLNGLSLAVLISVIIHAVFLVIIYGKVKT